MNKTQFLAQLAEKLSEELPRHIVLSNMEYYEGYINAEMAKGRSEEMILEELGNPYMIARTIIDAQTGEAFESQSYAEEVYTENMYTDDASASGNAADRSEHSSVEHASRTVEAGRHGCLIATIIIILIAVAVLAVLGSVISFLGPVLVPVLLILLAVSIVKDKKR